MRERVFLAGALLAALGSPAAAAQLIVNGDFETGNFDSWTRSGAAGSTSVNATAANGGDFGASFSPNQVGSLAQSLSTKVGQVYTIRFDLAHTAVPASAVNSFDFSFDFAGTTIQSYGNFGDYPFTTLTFIRVATGPVSTLKFNFRDARASAFFLDNVSVTGPVPEPATWTLMIGGFGLVGTTMRRRRIAVG